MTSLGVFWLRGRESGRMKAQRLIGCVTRGPVT